MKIVLNVGWDFDDIGFPWYDRAHAHVVKAGKNNGVTPVTWTPYEEYGISKEEWLEILDKGTLAGTLTGRGHPYPGVKKQFQRVKDAGHRNVIVTARGFFNHGPVIKQQTRDWLKKREWPVDAVHFTKDKTTVRLDYMIDDNLKNYDMLDSAGVKVYLHNRPWNLLALPDNRRRIDSAVEYVDIILQENV